MISVIIPTYNEAVHIGNTLSSTFQSAIHEIEIIVADGGSTDNTVELAKQSGAKVILCKQKGRAAQMNEGARHATGEVLYFLHADSIPPAAFTGYILDSYNRGAAGGSFRLAFDHDHWFLKIHCWFTRFNINALRFGDQSLFVSREVFLKSGGYREDLIMLEDQEIIYRINKHGKFKVMQNAVTTSARKYLDNGIYRMQIIFYRIWVLYSLGFSQQYLLNSYRKLIKQDKL